MLYRFEITVSNESQENKEVFFVFEKKARGATYAFFREFLSICTSIEFSRLLSTLDSITLKLLVIQKYSS